MDKYHVQVKMMFTASNGTTFKETTKRFEFMTLTDALEQASKLVSELRTIETIYVFKLDDKMELLDMIMSYQGEKGDAYDV